MCKHWLATSDRSLWAFGQAEQEQVQIAHQQQFRKPSRQIKSLQRVAQQLS